MWIIVYITIYVLMWYSLGHNDIGVEGGKAIAEALEINNTVTTMRLVLLALYWYYIYEL